MIYVGIDVAKDKHDCYVSDSDGVELYAPFVIQNTREGFEDLFEKVRAVAPELSEVKIGLEATGHYGYNILGYLLEKEFRIFLINPLHTNLFRKSLSLRQTKTDKVDARTICMMIHSGMALTPYSKTSYHMEELKSLTRYRFDKVQERGRLKQSISRLVTILFPALSHYNSLLKLDFNVILTLFVTFLMLVAAEGISNRLLNRLVVFALIMVTFCFDWGVIGPFMAWLFYQNRGDRKAQLKYYSIICAIQVASAAVLIANHGNHWYGELWQAGMFLVIPVLLCYNGEPGSKSPVNKWIFYNIYPLHLMVFWIIKYHVLAI